MMYRDGELKFFFFLFFFFFITEPYFFPDSQNLDKGFTVLSYT